MTIAGHSLGGYVALLAASDGAGHHVELDAPGIVADRILESGGA